MDAGQPGRRRGRFLAVVKSFHHPAFLEWAKLADLQNRNILEPFAGANRLIRHLRSMGLARKSTSCGIQPRGDYVRRRDVFRRASQGATPYA